MRTTDTAHVRDAWLDNFAHLLAKAGELDMDVQLAVSSSWDMGGPWVTPEHASKALYQATLQVEGPTRFEGKLPFPALARTAPRDEAGHLRYYSEAALLAIPNRERLPAHEFVFELPSDAGLPIDHVILYNVPDGFGARDFSVSVSTTDAADSSFTQMLRASLEPHANPQRKQTNGGIQLPLELPPHGSTFVVFRAASVRSDALPPKPKGERRALDIAGPWKVTFPAANETATFASLDSWTDHERESIRQYSGVARYQKELEIPVEWLGNGLRLELDLGELWAVARVLLNDEPMGIVWTPPYRVDLAKAARPGPNTLEIEVANTWANRLVGDSKLPEAQRRTRTNITGTGTPRVAWADLPLRDSGLYGPVRLMISRPE